MTPDREPTFFVDLDITLTKNMDTLRGEVISKMRTEPEYKRVIYQRLTSPGQEDLKRKVEYK